MTRLIIWRHGRTAWNLEGRVQGQTDVHMDAVGIAQAAEAAPRLAALQPDLLISSDLRRAADTAAALVAITGLQVEYDPRLRERDFGPWQGLHQEEIRAAYPVDFARRATGEPFEDQRIETMDDMMKRVGAALHDAATRVGDGTVVVVSHGGAAKAGCAAILGWPPMVLQTVEGLGNCRYSDLRRIPERGWRLRAHNV
jgi:broad specificity phosphatase PhoE